MSTWSSLLRRRRECFTLESTTVLRRTALSLTALARISLRRRRRIFESEELLASRERAAGTLKRVVLVRVQRRVEELVSVQDWSLLRLILMLALALLVASGVLVMEVFSSVERKMESAGVRLVNVVLVVVERVIVGEDGVVSVDGFVILSSVVCHLLFLCWMMMIDRI
jgi:hypothetical protein